MVDAVKLSGDVAPPSPQDSIATTITNSLQLRQQLSLCPSSSATLTLLMPLATED